jgi:RNA polymerase sigma factor (sigma-70 family)
MRERIETGYQQQSDLFELLEELVTWLAGAAERRAPLLRGCEGKDLVQTVVINLCEELTRYERFRGEFRTWLFKRSQQLLYAAGNPYGLSRHYLQWIKKVEDEFGPMAATMTQKQMVEESRSLSEQQKQNLRAAFEERETLSLDSPACTHDDSEAAPDWGRADKESPVYEEILKREVDHIFYDHWLKLKDPDREVVQWWHQDFKQQEIAERLHLSQAKVSRIINEFITTFTEKFTKSTLLKGASASHSSHD